MIQPGLTYAMATAPPVFASGPTELHSEPAHYVRQSSGNPGAEGEQHDRVELSAAGQELAARHAPPLPGAEREETPAGDPQKAVAGQTTGTDTEELSPEELRVVEELRARDREVRAHEAAHLANAGQYASGGASFTYQQGPDGRRYAVGGEVGIDTSKEQDPEATIRKMQTVRRAALAPANPSGTDRAVAAAAAAQQAEAQRELQLEKMQLVAEETTTSTTAKGETTATSTGATEARRHRFAQDGIADQPSLSLII
ncbi:MAG: hypothetical protein BWK76_02000 [Desulfobulbaceae bacterium A2]|nr:MAG: hypothetical protein BWK76_02000 [Desulfobulbaceae bacterium A2]